MSYPLPEILLVYSDRRRRTELARALRDRGLRISVADRIADLERWPSGRIVVVDAAQFTPWWAAVGAVRVLVLSGAATARSEEHDGVPCTWIPAAADPDAFIAAI